LFVNPAKFDFRFKSQTVAKQIKFLPFNYSEAGVYGSEVWKKLAVFNAAQEKKFNYVIEEMEIKNNK